MRKLWFWRTERSEAPAIEAAARADDADEQRAAVERALRLARSGDETDEVPRLADPK